MENRITTTSEVLVLTLFGCMAGTVTYEGDLLAPLDVAWETEAETEPNLYPRKRQGRRRG